MIAHETPLPGPAADFAAALAAMLPEIETPRLRLRAPRLTDAPLWAEVLTGPSGVHLGGPFDRDEAFSEFAAAAGMWMLRGHGLWTVESRADDGVLGFVLIGFEPGDQEPELGFLFLPQAEGRSIAHEAAMAARAHALAVMGLPALVSYVAPDNHRSQALARRLGARPEGTLDGVQVWRHHPLETRP